MRPKITKGSSRESSRATWLGSPRAPGLVQPPDRVIGRPGRRRRCPGPWVLSLLLLLLVWPACGGSDGPRSHEGIATRDAGWLRGDLHLHTLWSDGWDDTATVLRLAEYFESDTFLGAHPEFRGNGLDFLSITDHRTVDILDDPDFTSERLILLAGEEWGGPSHANCWGVTALVEHDPDGDGVTLQDVQDGIEAAHAQGALFSMNHPFLPGTPFPWDVRDHDAVEVWNAGWSLASGTFSATDLASWEAENGSASPFFRRAAQERAGGGSMQALRFYEAQLCLGIHVALVGGSDRHTGFPPGFPTTWVRAEAPGVQGVLDGIRSRHTFVSRTPASTQVLLEVTLADGTVYAMGDEIPIPAAGAEVTVTARVGRGDGGLLRLISGEAVADASALQSSPLGTVALQEAVAGDEFVAQTTLTVAPGDWIYPLVLDPLLAPGLPPEREELVREVARGAVATGAEDYGALADLVLDVIRDTELMFDAALCDPALWDPTLAQCLPPDTDGMATFYLPDELDRAINVITEDGEITDWAMGALGSAVRFVPREN